MIPTVEDILLMLKRGDCSHQQAMAWMEDHFAAAEAQAKATVAPSSIAATSKEAWRTLESKEGQEGLRALLAPKPARSALRKCRHGKVYDGTACPKCRDELLATMDTPRTDSSLVWAVTEAYSQDVEIVKASFARQLERELASMTRCFENEKETSRLLEELSALSAIEPAPIPNCDSCGKPMSDRMFCPASPTGAPCRHIKRESNERHTAEMMVAAARYAARRRKIFEIRRALQTSLPAPVWDDFVKEYDSACDKEIVEQRAAAIGSSDGTDAAK